MEIQEITIDDKQYPESLKNIKNPPKVLYYRGSFIKEEEKLFAIVGTRIPSDYGKEVTLKISSELAESGVTIISGMAPGIDTIAHKAVVEKGMRTIAVLGTGLDEESIYPKDNIGLSREIIENGGRLILELPAGTRGSKFTFPKRNRIVSGLSSGVLVVEAKENLEPLVPAG